MESQIPEYEATVAFFKDVPVFEVTPQSPTSLYLLGDNSLAALRSFIDTVHADCIFIERQFIDVNDLLIKDTMFKGISLELLGGVQLDSHVFNRDIKQIDLSNPVEMRVFVFYEGKAFGIYFVDNELDSLRRVTPEERVSMFVAERRKKHDPRLVITEKQENPALVKFAESLLHDSQYRALKSDEERFNHVIKIARRMGNDVHRKAISKEDGSGFSTERIRKVILITVDRMDTSRPEIKQMVFKKD